MFEFINVMLPPYGNFRLFCELLGLFCACEPAVDVYSHLVVYLAAERIGKYREIFADMCKYYDSGDATDSLMLNSLALELLYLLINDARRFGVRYGGCCGKGEIEATVKYIKENLTEPLTLDTLSERAGFSRVCFHNLFKTAVGKTLREFVEEERPKKAVNLLITTDMTLTEIAYESGFCSQSYFNYAFKRKMGEAPREYAKRIFEKYGEI